MRGAWFLSIPRTAALTLTAQLPLPAARNCGCSALVETTLHRTKQLATTHAKWAASHRKPVQRQGFGSPRLHSCLNHENMFSAVVCFVHYVLPTAATKTVQILQSTLTFTMQWFILQSGSFLCTTRHTRRTENSLCSQRNHMQFPHHSHNPPESLSLCLFYHQEWQDSRSDSCTKSGPRLQQQWVAGAGKMVLNASSPRAGAHPDVSWNGCGQPVAHRCLLAWSKNQEYQE